MVTQSQTITQLYSKDRSIKGMYFCCCIWNYKLIISALFTQFLYKTLPQPSFITQFLWVRNQDTSELGPLHVTFSSGGLTVEGSTSKLLQIVARIHFPTVAEFMGAWFFKFNNIHNRERGKDWERLRERDASSHIPLDLLLRFSWLRKAHTG